MSADLETLGRELNELHDQRDALTSTRTREDLTALVDEWIAGAQRRAAGSLGFVLNGAGTPDLVAAVLAEYALQDEGLRAWLLAKVDALDTAKLSAKAKAAKLKKLDVDEAIEAKAAQKREAEKQRALEEIEAGYAEPASAELAPEAA
jgi:hypothetical protein